MQRIVAPSTYFNAEDTLSCGQLFRFASCKNGYKVFSEDKACLVFTAGKETVIECAEGDEKYFYDYFDLDRDYSAIVNKACEYGGILKVAAKAGSGIRILNQSPREALFSFIVSQNNNIPRIKGIIERLCSAIGEKRFFDGEEYRAFPTAEKMAEQDEGFYKSIGLGYRAPFIARLAKDMSSGKINLNGFTSLTTAKLKEELKKIYGVGQKVADCASLFGFHRSDAFPVDVWIERVYRENFNGGLKDREKISEWFSNEFGENSGYFQQYLFYYKRELEKEFSDK